MLDSLKLVRSFLAVARLRSFSRAAEQLHMAQSTLTVQVRQLEEELGVRLLDRNQRRVLLTAVGGQILPALERLVLEAEAVVENTNQLSTLKRGLVSIAVLPSIAARLLPRALESFSRQYPGIEVRVHDVVAGRVLEMVKSGEAEVGIASDIPPSRELSAEIFSHDRLSAFIPLRHELARRARITLRELAAHALIFTGPNSSVRQLIGRAAAKEHLTLSPRYEVNYISTALGLVETGLGIAILPKSAGCETQGTTMRVAAIEKPTLTRTINLVRRSGTRYSAAAEALVLALKRMSGFRL